jgi:hydroxymethylglutaryl-CoA reductase
MTRLTFFLIITNFTTFETKDSMGANINSCLEQFAKTLKEESQTYGLFSESEKTLR